MKKAVFSKHFSALFALFILGDAVIFLPRHKADENVILGFVLSAFLGIALSLIITPLAKEIFLKRATILRALLLLCVATFSFWCFVNTLKNFCLFVSNVILEKVSLSIIVVLFLAVALFFASKRQEEILKFSLLAFVVVAVLIIGFFIFLSAEYNFRNIFIFKLPSLKELIGQTTPFLFNPVLQSVLPLFYCASVFGRVETRTIILGQILGNVLLGLVLLGTVLLFGAQFSGTLDYPFASYISTAAIGRLFSRLDGFSYIIYFLTALTKTTVSAHLIKNSLLQIKKAMKT